jgi:hypothetical protein
LTDISDREHLTNRWYVTFLKNEGEALPQDVPSMVGL